MSEATFTLRADEALKDPFTTAAKDRDRTGAQLRRDFMRDLARQQQEAAGHDARFRRQVQVGLDSANAGRLVPAEEVEADFSASGRNAPQARCWIVKRFWTPEALDDRRAIHDYIEANNPSAALALDELFSE